MKKLIVILLVVLSFAVDAKPLVYNHVYFGYTQFIYDVSDHLGIEETIYLIETDVKVKGFVRRIDSGYVVFVSSKLMYAEKRKTIAHELVHVKQDLDKRWDVNVGTTQLTGMGTRHVSKAAKEIEREADRLGKELYKKYGSTSRN